MRREIRSGPSHRYREWGIGDWSPVEVPVWPFVLAFECILSPKKVVPFFCFSLLFYFLSSHSRICLLAT